MPEARVNGINLYYEVSGREDGPGLLLSNSLGTLFDMWWPQMERLDSRFRVVRYDSRGHGRSEAPDAEYTMDQLGRDAVALLDHLDIATASVCGVSKGGMVAMWLGENAPERVDKLAMANTSAYLGPSGAWNSRIELVRKEGMAALVPILLERWFTAAFRARCPGDVKRVEDGLMATTAAGYAGCCAAIRDMDQRAGLAAIAAPTLVIGGLFDLATPPEHTRFLADSIPGAELVNLECAHLSNIERAREFNAALGDFL